MARGEDDSCNVISITLSIRLHEPHYVTLAPTISRLGLIYFLHRHRSDLASLILQRLRSFVPLPPLEHPID